MEERARFRRGTAHEPLRRSPGTELKFEELSKLAGAGAVAGAKTERK
jgi:hypothetical protein